MLQTQSSYQMPTKESDNFSGMRLHTNMIEESDKHKSSPWAWVD